MVQVVDVPPVEYVNDPQAVHFPLTNLYPALHVLQTPVVVEHAEHPLHAVHDFAVPPVEYVNDPHAIHELPDK